MHTLFWNIPCNTRTECWRVDYSEIYEFGSTSFAYIYGDKNVRGKKLLARSVVGYFVEIESVKLRIDVFISQTRTIMYV